jgi:PAS domain S-box-containing protein
MQAETQSHPKAEAAVKNWPAPEAVSLAGWRPKPGSRFFRRTAALAKANEALRAQMAERARVEQALRESEEKFRAIVETTSEWIWATDRRGLLTYSNPAVKTILGYHPEELLGKDCLTFLHGEDREQFGYMLNIFIEAKWGWKDLVLRWRHRNGTYRYLERNGTPILDTAGEVIGYRGTDRDITERKRIEEALADERASLARRVEERTAELTSANAELAKIASHKDDFLASMSHELRTPLNAILGLSESLQEQVYGQLNEKQLRSLHSIEESGRHLLSLLNDILDLSKVEAGQIQLQIDTVCVSSVCQASIRLIREIAQKKHLKLSLTLDKQLNSVPADERRLKQILVNLLGNAVKFTPEGGTIGLDVVQDASQNAVRFTVWDTGIGISPADLPRLFQQFVQLDSRLSRQYAGTGLGLVLVRRMVEMHGGKVTVESAPGKGSRFNVSLPLRDKEGKGAAFTPARSGLSPVLSVLRPDERITGCEKLESDGPSPLILLAEDNELNVETMSDYLRAKGYRLSIARSGREAIERAKADNPDLILMDIQMPDVDGLEATRGIRSMVDLGVARIPIIAVTALAMPGDRECCLKAGANDYFSKPVNFKTLLSAIEARCARSNQYSTAHDEYK